MAHIKSKNQLVSSYYTSIILVFFILVVTDFILAGIKYSDELDYYKKSQYQKLSKEMAFVNTILSQSVNALAGMRDFANYYLDNPNTLTATFPKLLQDNNRFYLKKTNLDVIKYRQPLGVNITGIGLLSGLSTEVKQELIMSYAIAPAFIAAEKSNSEANWFYYASFSKFISMYPWINRNTWQYSKKILDNPQMDRIRQAKKGEETFYWSLPYEDTASKGVNISVGAPVFRGEQVTGAVIIDLSLGRIHEKLTAVEVHDHGIAIIDKYNNILIHKTLANPNIMSNYGKHSAIPSELADLTYQSLFDNNKGTRIGRYFVQHMRVPVNDWVIVNYQPYSDVVSQVTSQFITSFVLSLIALLALLIIIYVVTRRTFIKPTQQFIAHIEYSAQGDHGKIKPPIGWGHWFQLVEDIFSQNRSLLQQLKDQNKVLDIRVNEKTQALREKSEQHQYDYAILRSVMDAIPDYLIFNDLSHNVIGCNLAFEQLIGVSEKNILGKKASDLFPKELGGVLNCDHHHNAESKGTLNIIETLESTYEVFVEQFYNNEQVLLGTIVIIRDVTERTAITSALKQAKIQAENANRAKSQFLANMSHEIRTPINAIQGMHFLLTQSGLTSGQKIHLDNAEVASTALLHLVDELLDLAKIESGNMSIVKASTSIDRVVNQAVKLNIGNALCKDLKISVDIHSNVPQRVISDEMRLVQVLSNLLNNAVKFTHQGEIKVVIENIGVEENNALVKFTVSDTGIGIAKEKQAYLFEAFRQADESMTRQYGGSGLGLSICRQIVNLLDSDITIISDIDQGAEFSFVLPLKIDKKHVNQLQLNIAYTFVNVGVDLCESFIENFHVNQCSYLRITELNEVLLQSELKSLPLVLFLNSESLTEQECQLSAQLMTEEGLNIGLFVLCQNSYQAQNNKALKWFDDNQLPYVVCEQPMYRYCLMHIFDALRSGINNSSTTPQTQIDVREIQGNKNNLAGLTIMLVEDNLVNQLVAKELLLSMKAEVILAENGKIALDLLTLEPHVDLILMDIQMPVLDGLTATREIRQIEKYAKTPIIAMTAHARDEDREQSLEAGMDMHIAKPVKAGLLLSSILSFFK